MDNKPINYGLLLVFEGEPAESSPLDIKAMYQIIKLNELVNPLLMKSIRENKNIEEIDKLLCDFNKSVENLFTEEIKELKENLMSKLKEITEENEQETDEKVVEFPRKENE